MRIKWIIAVCLVLIVYFLVSPQRYETDSADIQRDIKEYVILLHGLARSSRSMLRIEKSLSLAGYKVINVDYPSTKHTIEFLADEILRDIVSPYMQEPQSKVHFVTHSMGGIVVRYYLRHHDLPNLGRVVMLCPPNQGSELVNRLKNSFFFKKAIGPPGGQLGTKEDSLPLSLGPVNFELGVIAGDRTINPLYSLIIPGPDDGVISVERTKVAGMKDFIVLPHSHTFIMQSEPVIEQVLYFLKLGVFKKKE